MKKDASKKARWDGKPTSCIKWLQLDTYMQHKKITFLGKNCGVDSSLSDVQFGRRDACSIQLCW